MDKPVWAECPKGVQFTVYDRENGERDVYFLAIDWYKEPSALRYANLIISGNKHKVTFPFGTMIKVSVWLKYAAYPHTENAEVISVKDGIARV